MKCLNRNKKPFHYCTYQGKEELIDSNGYRTADYKPIYSEWKEYAANISPAKGESYATLFGNTEQYDRVIVTSDMDCEIDENTVLAVDIEPTYDSSGTPVCDYVVTKKAVSLNVIAYAITKVKVNA